MNSPVDMGKPSTWVRFRPSLCEGCQADCCRLPVEVTAADLLRLGLVAPDECQGSLKRVARRLIEAGIVKSFSARTGLFTLEQRHGGDCQFLGTDRRCTVYERRPDVCREFPRIGPRPQYCPARTRYNGPRASSNATRRSDNRPQPRHG